MSLRTFDQMHKDVGSCVYWGERGHWLVVAGRHRDSDALERSNFRSILKALGGEGDTVAVENESHWAVGWVEHLLVDPADTERVKIAEEIRDALEDYPVVDEEDFSNLEYEEAWSYWESELKGTDGWEETIREVLDEGNYGYSEDESYSVLEEARRRLTIAGRVKRAVAKTDDAVEDVIDSLLGVLLEMADEESAAAMNKQDYGGMNRWSAIAHKLLRAQQEIAEM